MTPDLAILYEHPLWFEPLFAALDRRGISYARIRLDDHSFDPARSAPPAPVIFSRVAMSGFLREPDHGIFYAAALLDAWRQQGARLINGDALAIDSSKARQLSLIAGLGYKAPETRIVHRARDLAAAAEGLAWPLLVKANIGGSGAGIIRYDTPEQLAAGPYPDSIDKVLLLQEYAPARGGRITRVETLGGKFLYAIDIESDGGFDLCPADACIATPGRAAVRMTATTPPLEVIKAAESIAQAAHLDVGGIEYLIDDRDGEVLFYDINALSNFVARPLDVLGWDPHEALIDLIEARIAERKAS